MPELKELARRVGQPLKKIGKKKAEVVDSLLKLSEDSSCDLVSGLTCESKDMTPKTYALDSGEPNLKLTIKEGLTCEQAKDSPVWSQL